MNKFLGAADDFRAAGEPEAGGETTLLALLQLRDELGDEDFAAAAGHLARMAGGGFELSAADDSPVPPGTPDDALALARFYAGLLADLEEAGDHAAVRQVAELADDELDGTGYAVARARRGWAVADESEDGEEEEGYTLAATHGVGEKWQGQSGRWFTKRQDGRVVPTRDPHAPEGKAKERIAQRAAKGGVDREALAQRLQRHAEGHEPGKAQSAWARSAARMFQRHHGENALHRIEELADLVEGALGRVQGQTPAGRNLRDRLTSRLRQLRWAMDHLEGKPEPSGAKAEPEAPKGKETTRKAGDYAASLPDGDRKALERYAKSSVLLNTALTRGEALTPQEEELAAAMDRIIAGAPPLPGGAKVYRGVGHKPSYGEAYRRDMDALRSQLEGALGGGEVAIPAYASASLSDKQAAKFAPGEGGFILEISSPRGVQVAGASDYAQEKEVILPRGAKFRVVGKKEIRHGKRTIAVYEVEHLPADAGARPPEPGFTGTDALGREWRDGELVAKREGSPKPMGRKAVIRAIAHYAENYFGGLGDDSRISPGAAEMLAHIFNGDMDAAKEGRELDEHELESFSRDEFFKSIFGRAKGITARQILDLSNAAKTEELRKAMPPPGEAMTPEQTSQWAMAHYADWIVNANEDGQLANVLSDYTSDAYPLINQFLRDGTPPSRNEITRSGLEEGHITKAKAEESDRTVHQIINQIDGAFRDVPATDRPIKLARVVGTTASVGGGAVMEMSQFGNELLSRLRRGEDVVGMVMQDNAYQSTSLPVSGGRPKPGAINLDIDVPAGAKILPIAFTQANMGEDEMLLPRGGKFRVKSVRRVEGDPSAHFERDRQEAYILAVDYTPPGGAADAPPAESPAGTPPAAPKAKGNPSAQAVRDYLVAQGAGPSDLAGAHRDPEAVAMVAAGLGIGKDEALAAMREIAKSPAK